MPVPRRFDGNPARSPGSSPDRQINIRPVPESKRSRGSPLQRTHQKVCQGWVTFLGRGLSRQLLVSVIRVPTIRGGRDRFCLAVINHRFSAPGTVHCRLTPKSPPVRVAETSPCTNPNFLMAVRTSFHVRHRNPRPSRRSVGTRPRLGSLLEDSTKRRRGKCRQPVAPIGWFMSRAWESNPAPARVTR
jgi:hypothetical protein